MEVCFALYNEEYLGGERRVSEERGEAVVIREEVNVMYMREKGCFERKRICFTAGRMTVVGKEWSRRITRKSSASH
jgi:hypothetical protein